MRFPPTAPQHIVTHSRRIGTAVLLGVFFFGACAGPPSSPPSSSPEAGTRVYHVQLQLTEDKARAEAILSRGLRWWKNQPASTRPPLVRGTQASDAVSIKWRAPFYRVRIGPFATEQQAETVLEEAHPAFPDAFVAPDRVEASS